PAVGLLEARQQPDEGALAAPGGPDHHRELVALDGERAVAHHLGAELRVAVALEDVVDPQLAGLDPGAKGLRVAWNGAHRTLSQAVTSKPRLRMIALDMQPAGPMLIMPTTMRG